MVVDLSSLIVKKLDDNVDSSQFKCKSQEIQDFFTEYALVFQNKSLGVSYIVYNNSKMVGFFTISMDSLRIKKIKTDDQIGYAHIDYYPSIKIGQLCVDIDYENQGIGPFMLNVICGIGMEFSEKIGCRFLSVNTLPSAQTWYEKHGFTPLKDQKGREKLSYYLDISKLEQ
ncbi:MAG: GNAT family N-acetyltransferase [Methanosarcinales archaeon]|nr:GNAT family N-acetyltransferase [Methanosarcinales archaeon]